MLGSSRKSYKYAYDQLNRFSSAVYAEYSGTAWNQKVGHFNESVGDYDLNGNIKRLIRYRSNNNVSEKIDDLTYTYDTNNPNRILSISDAGNTIGFNNKSTSTIEYTYNANGSLLKDINKGMSSNILYYDEVEQAKQISWAADKTLQFTYDAASIRLKKVFTSGTTIKETQYHNNFIYSKTGTGSPVLQ